MRTTKTRNSRLRVSFGFVAVIMLLLAVSFLPSAAQEAVQAGWRFDIEQGKSKRSNVSINNICKRPHRFRIKNHIKYLSFAQPTNDILVGPASTEQIGVVFDATGLESKVYNDNVVVQCLDCKKEKACKQDRTELPIEMAVINSTSQAFKEKDETGSNDPRSTSSLIVPITLPSYWYETISRQEAFRRLDSHHLDPNTLAQIKEQVPPETKHYLTFDGGVFREFADFGDGTANLLLLLPANKKGDTFQVSVPIYHSERYADGRPKDISGIEIHEFRAVGTKLEENGLLRETFRFSENPIKLNVDASFIAVQGPSAPRAKPGRCCRACEWVHSTLDIHCADWLCCLGSC